MLYALAAILLLGWLLGLFAFHVGGALIHLLLVIAVIAIVANWSLAGERSDAAPFWIHGRLR